MIFSKVFLSVIRTIIKEKKNTIIADEIFNDELWVNLRYFISKQFNWYVITPANFDYCKCVYNLSMSKSEFANILRERILILRQNGVNINLCLFLGKIKEQLNDNYQNNLIKEGIDFLNSLEVYPGELHIIDNVYDKNTYSIAKKYGIKNINDLGLYFHPYLLFFLKLLRIKRSFIQEIYTNLKLKNILNIFYLLSGEIITNREKTIHVEALVLNNIWNEIKKKIVSKNFILYIITPANYDYCNTYFNLEMDKKEFSEILAKRIKYLKKKNEEIQLHLHLSINKEFINEDSQKQKFTEAFKFMNSLGIYPKKFVAGWWNYNTTTVNLAKQYGINEISDYTINPFLRELNVNGMKIKYTHKYWHDFDF